LKKNYKQFQDVKENKKERRQTNWRKIVVILKKKKQVLNLWALL